KAAPANLTARGATLGVAWDFSKIPAFPPDRRSRPQAQSRLVAPPVSGAISRKLFVGQPSERLEHDFHPTSAEEAGSLSRIAPPDAFAHDFSSIPVYDQTQAASVRARGGSSL